MKRIILSISGGGAGGESSAYGLSSISHYIDPLLDEVSAFAGTSVGAIEAAYLAHGGSTIGLHEVLKKNIYKAFTKNSWFARHFKRAPRYNSSYLRDILQHIFGDITMNELKTECYIVAYRVTDDATAKRHRRIKVFSSADTDVKVVDAVLASAAAPWFFGSHTVNGVVYGDGGLVDNLPSVLALAHQVDRTRHNPEFFRLLSVVTGGSEKGNRSKFKFGSIISLAKNIPGDIIPADIDGEILKADRLVGEKNHLVLRPPLSEFDLDDVKIQTVLKREWSTYLSNEEVLDSIRKWRSF